MKDTLILAIESSCDETAASVVKNGRTILSNVISSQIALHTLYGGVVPEIASRKHIEKIKKTKERLEAESTEKLTREKVIALAEEALKIIPARVEYFAKVIGVTYGKITIRNQKTRWGSCSSKGNLNFNCLLMLAPPEVLDYVVVHELCHRKQMNHSKAFWLEVEKVLPDYKEARKWLKEEGSQMITLFL